MCSGNGRVSLCVFWEWEGKSLSMQKREGKSLDPFAGNREGKSLCSGKWRVSLLIPSVCCGNGKVSLVGMRRSLSSDITFRCGRHLSS